MTPVLNTYINHKMSNLFKRRIILSDHGLYNLKNKIDFFISLQSMF